VSAFYSEFDPFASKWLNNLQAAGEITGGKVDGRDFRQVVPDDVHGYERCHFFAGIGGWDLALSIAEWEGPVWTASLPCQPFSAAGRRLGEKDERHLFPDFAKLVKKCKPPIIFGEQVASKDGKVWLAGVRSQMEAMGYSFGAADLCAAGVGAPHIRQRLFWVAHSEHIGPIQREHEERSRPKKELLEGSGLSGGLGHAKRRGFPGEPRRGAGQEPTNGLPTGGTWGQNWISCADGKARRLEPGIMPLAHGVPGRVGLICGYGNAIVPQVAAEFIRASRDAINDMQ